jgi:hypothetical protein
MRHPHGLRAAAGGDVGIPIGDAYEGGFFAGYISHTANGVPTHGLIVAPAATGASGGGYTITTYLQWKTTDTFTAGTSSTFDGAANSAAMNNASHPAAHFCESLTIGGYSDWYLPARYELDIAYQNLKPTTTGNDAGFGVNQYSVPERTTNRTASIPPQTSIAAFQSGGAEAFVDSYHWSSSEVSVDSAWITYLASGSVAINFGKTNNYLGRTRAFRKFAV